MAGKLAKVIGHLIALPPFLPIIYTQTGWDWYKEIANDFSEDIDRRLNAVDVDPAIAEEGRKTQATLYWQAQYQKQKNSTRQE